MRQKKIPAIRIDSGNFLFGKNTSASRLAQARITALGIVDIYRAMQYDAVAVGLNDLQNGIDFLKDISASGFPLLSANIVDHNASAIFQPSIIQTAGTLRIGIIGLTDTPAAIFSEYSILSWQQVLPQQIAALTANCDLLVLLSNLSLQENNIIAREYPQIHVLISADRNKGNLAPKLVNNTLITQTHSQGKYLGVLDITWAEGQKWQPASQENQETLHSRLASVEWQITRLNKRQNATSESTKSRIAKLNEHKQQLLTRITELEKAQISSTTASPLSTFASSFIPLRTNMPQSPDIDKKISEIKNAVRVSNKPSPSKPNPISPKSAIAAQKTIPDGYAGQPSCKACHPVQTEFWHMTDHAQAYATLQAKGREYDLQCLACHVTWNNSDSQLDKNTINLLKLPASRHAVGCESCHGASELHLRNPAGILPKKIVAEQTCRTCHTIKMDTEFNYKKMLKMVACPQDSNQPKK